MNHTFATIVTRIFDPFITLTVLFILALIKSSLHTIPQIQWFAISGLMMIGIPLGLFVWLLHTGKIKNWDVSDRRERPKLFLFLLFYEILCLFFVRPLIDAFLFQTFLTVTISFAGFSLITLFWKISGHAFISALATGFIVQWFGWSWWPVLLIVPLVSWSRVVRGDHSRLQVFFGALYGWFSIVVISIL